ncbi:protease inhibitor I42 family protein, partial [Streptomyces sp. PSKA30]|uniref:protease inhibitor I42 family protein n=1 Tax=Streptomyces sp. PSKA30 TaxID=2874597 RepID=UPI001CD146B3
MSTRTLLLGAATLAALFTVTGCGDPEGGGAAHGPEDRAITVQEGEEFSLTLPASPSLNQHWYLTDPRPDASVLKYRGEREDREGSDLEGGGDGTQSFDFTALKKGRTTVRLLWCPMNTCRGPSDTGTALPTGTG